MARPIVLSNGDMHVGINNYGLVHDFYFPYVGLENHSAGRSLRHRVGVWVDGKTYWIDEDDGDWQFQFRYPHSSLIGHTLARSDKLGLLLEFDDFVDAYETAFMRNIHVVNLWDKPREVRVFMHQAFVIGDSRSNTDTAQYLPDSNAILHYRGNRAFIVSGQYKDQPFDQHTIGIFGIEGREGTFRDADDGELSFGNIEHGQVDSTIRFKLDVAPHSSERFHYWIAAGTSIREALAIDKSVREQGVIKRLHGTATWWHEWLKPALQASQKLDVEFRESFVKSVMILKSQIDNRGAIMASTDSAMLNYSRDAYAYSWPRDGAYVLWPLIRMGYRSEAKKFFDFCKDGLHPNGYLMHKYFADGALGPSWHPYLHEDNIVAPPIQEDETALVLFVFAQFYQHHKDRALLDEYYDDMIKPMADFMAGYIDDQTCLPKPTYDLWEEYFLTSTYTTSVVYAALLAAAELAEEVSDNDSAVKWRSSAEDIQSAAQKHLFNEERGAFYKGVLVKNDGIEYNDTIDTSSFFGAFMYGLFPADSSEMKRAADAVRDVFNLKDGNYGVPRYENDYYHRKSDEVLGNWWFITSLWMAQYLLEVNDTETARHIIEWVRSKALSTGVLSEQINPLNGELLSVAPLTWSHAEYIATLLDTITEVK
jgi:GH15 family glucan-1,4-alpha-glucosidase